MSKKTIGTLVAAQVQQALSEYAAKMTAEIERAVPELVAEAFGIPTGDQAIAQHVDRLVAKGAPAKRRGRPRKEGTSTANGAQASAHTVEAQSAPKRRGRPKGSKNKPKDSDSLQAAGSEAPKRRGRPKGSKNKPKSAAPAPQNGSRDSVYDALRNRVANAANAEAEA